jgi:hypothetical protein
MLLRGVWHRDFESTVFPSSAILEEGLLSGGDGMMIRKVSGSKKKERKEKEIIPN